MYVPGFCRVIFLFLNWDAVPVPAPQPPYRRESGRVVGGALAEAVDWFSWGVWWHCQGSWTCSRQWWSVLQCAGCAPSSRYGGWFGLAGHSSLIPTLTHFPFLFLCHPVKYWKPAKCWINFVITLFTNINFFSNIIVWNQHITYMQKTNKNTKQHTFCFTG